MQVEISGLRKVYQGGITALHGLDLTIPAGIFGLLGPNGSGKTTLMRILATLLEPTSGEARVGGHDVRREKAAVRELLGYMPEEFGFYPNLTAYEMLDYLALLCRINDQKERRSRVERALQRVNLDQVAGQRVGTFSSGMKRRLGIAQAILNNPRVLIMDEPTSGLDPEERVRLRNLLAELAGDRVVILSTHIVNDIASIGQRLAILRHGRCLFSGRLSDLLEPLRGRTWIIDIEEDELSRIRQDFEITGVFRSATGMQVRLLSDAMSHPRGYATEPALDDAYVALMNRDAAQTDTRGEQEADLSETA
ncbi:MAG: ABC transporter ATP-binding protein [Armatimonadetes bacterium]|nr:ABC transporter ATP-binding protein [Armatimonadota bacterium]